MSKKLIAIVGPTASGKTQIAIELARFFETEIINCDSRQIFIDFTIATAKPDKNQLAMVKHYLVDFLSPLEDFTVKDFQIKADEIITNSIKPFILAGGTGLYFQAIEKELDEIPAIPSDVRLKIQNQLETHGIQFLIEELKSKDPKILEIIDIKNPRRLSRALEVFEVSGKSILSFWNQNPKNSKYQMLWLGIDLGWEKLENNIRNRIEEMFLNGLVEETLYLQNKYPISLKAFKAIGYYEVIEFLKGKISLHEAKNQIFIKTRQYAKRQLTWFKKNKNIHWLQNIDFDNIKKILQNFLF